MGTQLALPEKGAQPPILYSTLFTTYTAAIKENKSTIKQSSKQHTSI